MPQNGCSRAAFFMLINPVLIEQTRGDLVENRHRAAFVFCDEAGRVIASAGDIERPVLPRSAVKSMQALALFTTGAVERFAVTDPELALCCASHHGEAPHVAQVAAFLQRLGLGEADLECGTHWPANAAARDALREAGRPASPLHHNCSGKHAGMLAGAKALGAPTTGYVQRDHPVQLEVRRVLELVLGEPVVAGATDGCSIPTWAAPLRAFARGFARMASGTLPDGLAAGARRLFDAATSHPHLVAGTGHFDTQAMATFAGRVVQKGGAEGVQCGAIRDRGWGYAIKVDDGNMNASIALVANVLLALAAPDGAQRAVLDGFARQPVRNVRGAVVGELRASAELAEMLGPRKPA